MIDVKKYCLGMWQTNSYLVTAEGSKDCWIVDAGFEPKRMIDDIKREGYKPELLIITHAHLDHIAGADEIKEAFPGIKTAISEAEASFLGDPAMNLSASAGMEITAGEADILLSDGQELDFHGMDFVVMTTPGHSPGGICLYQEDEGLLFAGDTLFQRSVGRYDFPTSNGEDLFNSIRTKLLPLPVQTKVFPGHGGSTSIGEEKEQNPFLR